MADPRDEQTADPRDVERAKHIAVWYRGRRAMAAQDEREQQAGQACVERATPAVQPTIEQLRDVVSMLANFAWTRKLRPGEHLWTIPADPQRDFDFILLAAIDELERFRKREQALSAVRQEAEQAGAQDAEIARARANHEISQRERAEIAFTQSERKRLALIDALTEARQEIERLTARLNEVIPAWNQETERANAAESALTAARQEIERLRAAQNVPPPECAHGHQTRRIGCVSCVLVFDNTGPAAPPQEQE